MTFWLGFIFGVLAMWLLIGLALTAWLIRSLKGGSIAAVLLPLLLAGCAGQWLVVNAASYHKDRDKGYNERNAGVGVEQPIGADARLIAGTYRNSHRRQSWYAGVQWTPLQLGGLHLGGAAGAVTGYEPGKPSPLLTPVIAYETRTWGVNLLPFDGAVVGLQFKLRFE